MLFPLIFMLILFVGVFLIIKKAMYRSELGKLKEIKNIIIFNLIFLVIEIILFLLLLAFAIATIIHPLITGIIVFILYIIYLTISMMILKRQVSKLKKTKEKEIIEKNNEVNVNT